MRLFFKAAKELPADPPPVLEPVAGVGGAGGVRGRLDQDRAPPGVARGVGSAGAHPEPDDLMAHWRDLLRHARRLMSNESDAQDLASDTYERALRALDRYTPGTNMRAWLYTIMVRLAHDHFRRLKSRTVRDMDLDEMPAPELDVSPPPWAGITDQQLQEALEHVSPVLRQVFELQAFHNLPYHDIAARLNIPVNTVASRLRRARERLKELLSGTLGLEAAR